MAASTPPSSTETGASSSHWPATARWSFPVRSTRLGFGRSGHRRRAAVWISSSVRPPARSVRTAGRMERTPAPGGRGPRWLHDDRRGGRREPPDQRGGGGDRSRPGTGGRGGDPRETGGRGAGGRSPRGARIHEDGDVG